MEVVTACGSKLGGYLVEPIINQARYLFCFDNIVKDLEEEENNLKLAYDRIKNEVEREEDNAKEIEKDVEKWLKDVVDAMADVQKLNEEIQVKKRCFNGLCPNWGWRWRLGREATKMTSRMLKLRNSGKFSTVAHLKRLPGIGFFTPKDFMPFKATELASEQIIEALKNEKTKMVGLYGAGGAGKTTLAEFVGNELKQQKIFDEVVLAVVSQHPNIINVQKKLAEALRLELNEETKEDRAKRLYLRFTNPKSKILIILDDVWKVHNLEKELGIPVGDDHNGCKILLTTRRKNVCDVMRCNLRIELGFLTLEEGWTLLKRYADIGVDDDTLMDVSKEVAGKCGGLPLAIGAVGSALRGKDVDQWELASEKLKTVELDEVDGIEVDIYACLKWSYDYLKCETSKLLFLLCSLFPEDDVIELEDLVRYGVGLGWYKDKSIEKARSLLRGKIKDLKASSLLLDTGHERVVKMHDIVRDVALWIISKDGKFFNKAGIGLTEWPEDEGLEQYTGISLMGNSINVLPNGLECPNLHILLLGNIGYKFDVPDQFFEGMKALKVVTIIGGNLSLKSLQFLTNLEVLQLINCHVREDITFLKELKKLQILCLKGSSYSEDIPRDLGDKLNKLKLLDFGYRSRIEIHSVILTGFSRLQEFYGIISDWEIDGIRFKNGLSELDFKSSFPELSRYDIRNTSFFDSFDYSENQRNSLRMAYIEATSLVIFSALYKNLQYLKLHRVSGCENIVPNIDQSGLNKLTFLGLNNCKDLRCIYDTSQHEESRNGVILSRLEKLSLFSLPKLLWIWRMSAQHVSLRYLTVMTVMDCNKLTHLFTPSQARSLEKLKVLTVQNCERLKYIVGAESDDNKSEINITLPMLRELRLDNLPDLLKFCSGNYYSTWQALQELILSNCPHLTINAEVQASVQYFVENLQTLHVRNCGHVYPAISALMKHGLKSLQVLRITGVGVQEVYDAIMGGDGEESKLFPSLKELGLGCLTELEVLYKGPKHTFSLPNLTILRVDKCNRLTYLFSPTLAQNLLQLKELIISNCSELEQIIDDREDLDHLQPTSFTFSLPNLTILSVDKCNRLTYLFSPTLAQNLLQLKELRIGNCSELEQIIDDSEDLDHLQPTSFTFSLPNLTILFVIKCNRLTYLFSPTLAQNLLQLKELSIINCSELEQIIDDSEDLDHLQPTSFTFSLPNLTILSVDKCNRLTYLFSPTLPQNLLQLKELRISNCSELEQIIDDSEDLDHLRPTSFPKLRILWVKMCPKLKHLFHISVAPSLEKLEQLTICDNDELVEVFWQKKDGAGVVDVKEFVMTQLSQLELVNLPKLTNFCPENYLFTCSSLSHLYRKNTPESSLNGVMSSRLVGLQLIALPKLQWIWKMPDQQNCNNLTRVYVMNCNNLTYLFTLSQAQSLKKLYYLEVEDCASMEWIVRPESDDNTNEINIALPMLKELRLQNLRNLVSFCLGNFYSTWHSLRRLNLIDCPCLSIRAEVEASVQYVKLNCNNLTRVKVVNCNNLTYLFTPSQAQSLKKLEFLNVRDCASLECIVAPEFDDDKSQINIALPMLKELHLVKLGNLVSFCSENFYSTWHALQKLTLIDCPCLSIEASVQYFVKNCNNLTIVEVVNCNNLTYLFTPSQAQSLKKLKFLIVRDCASLECIVGPESDDDKSQINIALPMLIGLYLERLGNLASFCSGNLYSTWHALQELTLIDCPCLSIKAIVQYFVKNCNNLTRVEVENCNNLTYLFTPSQAQSLKKLEYLKVEDCASLECIVGPESDDNKSEINIALPMLKELHLENLGNLVRFCSGNFYSTWHALQELTLIDCPWLSIRAEVEASVPYVKNLQTLCVRNCRLVYPVISAQRKHYLKSLEELRITGVGVQEMKKEDSMAEDTVPTSSPAVPAFGQQPISPPSSFVFGPTTSSGANPFPFGSQQTLVTPQNPSPFQASSSLDFNAGGSFSLGTSGSDKSQRRMVKVRKPRKK